MENQSDHGSRLGSGDTVVSIKTTTSVDVSKIGIDPIDQITKIGLRYDKCIQDELDLIRSGDGDFIDPQSHELTVLEKEYNNMKEHLKSVLLSVKKYHNNVKELSHNRSEVIEALAAMSRGTPLEEYVVNDAKKSRCIKNIYQLAGTQCSKDNDRYLNDIIYYIMEWECIMTMRIDSELKQYRELRKSKLHYEIKVPTLRKKLMEYEMKNPNKRNHALSDKLNRNEQKLHEVMADYTKHTTALTILLEEAIICSWKDLYPLLISLMKYDYDRAAMEHTVFKNLKSSLYDDMKYNFKLVKDYKAVRLITPNHDDDDDDEDNDPEEAADVVVHNDDDEKKIEHDDQTTTNRVIKPQSSYKFNSERINRSASFKNS